MFFICLLISIAPCITFYIIATDKFWRSKRNEKIVEEKKTEITVIQELDNLENHVKSMTIPEYNKEKILRVIDFEKDVIKYSIIKELGKIEYEKLRK